MLLTEEVRGRDEATRRTRWRTAGLPAGKTFASWREADSSIPAPTQQALATLEWIGRAENLAVAGPSGTGKTHLVEALSHAAIDTGCRVAWFTLETLTAAIGPASVDAAYERRSVAVTSNLHPSGFDTIMPAVRADDVPTQVNRRRPSHGDLLRCGLPEFA